MATTVTSTSHYAGKEAGKIIGKAFKEAATLQSGFVTLVPNINYKLNLRKIELTGGRRAYTCGFVPSGAIVLSEKVLEPKKFKDDFEVCKEDFRNQWDDGGLGESAWNEGDMKVIMDAIIAEKLAKEAEALDADIWTGDGGETSEFDGFLTLFEADANIITVDGTAITEDNVLAEIKKVKAAIPIALRKKPVRIGVSPDIANAYNDLLLTKGILNGLGGDANATIKLGKYTLEELPGLPENTMVAAIPENLLFGTGLQSDHNEIKIVDSDAVNLDGKFKGTMVYNAGVEYYNPEEIVWYRVETPSV